MLVVLEGYCKPHKVLIHNPLEVAEGTWRVWEDWKMNLRMYKSGSTYTTLTSKNTSGGLGVQHPKGTSKWQVLSPARECTIYFKIHSILSKILLCLSMTQIRLHHLTSSQIQKFNIPIVLPPNTWTNLVKWSFIDRYLMEETVTMGPSDKTSHSELVGNVTQIDIEV